MIKSILSFSKKVPANEQYSSQSYHLSMEAELSENLRQDELQAEITRRFDTIRSIVDSQLQEGQGVKNGPTDPGSNNVEVQRGGNGAANARATNKQVAYACALAEEQGIKISELNKHAGELYNVTSLYELSSRDASKLIDGLKHHELKAA